MRKFFLLFPVLVFLSSCSTTNEYKTIDINSLSGLEKVVLCEETMEAAKAMGNLKNPDLYGTKNRRFYYPLNSIKALGMEVKFVGYGVMYINGPNVTVTGNHNDLRGKVEKVMGKTTTCKNNLCGWKISEKKSVLVYPHQEDSTMAIVQCAYGTK